MTLAPFSDDIVDRREKACPSSMTWFFSYHYDYLSDIAPDTVTKLISIHP
jgi:hypothetical protein